MRDFIIIIIILIFSQLSVINNVNARSDVTFVGPMKFADGLFRISIGLIDTLKNDLKINFISTGVMDLSDVPVSVQKLVLANNTNKKLRSKNCSPVAIMLDSPWHIWDSPYKYMPDSKIKIAYSMLEGDAIPSKWVDIFNNYFDAIVVPDKYLSRVYKNCGVNIPVFVVPIGLYLEDFLLQPIKQQKNNIFTFGCSAFFSPGKNQKLIIEAFAQEFKNNPMVKLKLHGRFGDTDELNNLIKQLDINNVEIIQQSFSHQDYIKFFSQLDCYVLLSQGEGFSITPREALALGIPCILSNNTAHKTICNTGLVRSVKSDIPVPAYYNPLGGYYGSKFNCDIANASDALKEVYNNYNYYLSKSLQARQWVKQYLYKNLKPKYLSLIKPKKVILGPKNKIENNYLITNSRTLYKKYLSLKNKKI